MTSSDDTFDGLGVSPELLEALAAEAIEQPFPLQVAAVPVLRKGNNLVLAAGPGCGLLAAWAVGVLDRVEPGDDGPRVLVLTADPETAEALAEALARLTAVSGHTVATLGGSWHRADSADVLLGTAETVHHAVSAGRVSLGAVRTVVVNAASAIEAMAGLGGVEAIFDYLAPETQRVVTSLPVTPAVSDLVERHLRRAVTVPAPQVDKPPERGSVRFRITAEPREGAALSVVAHLLEEEGASHVLVFARSEDRAADVGDYLTLHGYPAGAPGEADAPVWLGVDALEARAAVAGVEGLRVVSADVPADPDALDRRHALGKDGVAVVLARELAHFKHLGRVTGYDTVPFPPKPAGLGAVAELRRTLERAMRDEDTAPYLAALEPLFERHDPSEVAAAAVALLRKKGAPPAGEAPTRSAATTAPAAAPSWAKLFIDVGERDGLRPGDLVGAITGEAGVSGDAVGKIEIRESHSLVEVHDTVAKQVIRGINGTTIKGRAVRADFDRPRKGPPRRRRPRS